MVYVSVILALCLQGSGIKQSGAQRQTTTHFSPASTTPQIETNPAEFPGGEWPMAGANPGRTSWTSEEVRGSLNIAWYKVFEPYILPRVQVIAANGSLYISTARGLYALDARSGDQEWVFPTELPLGNSPTIQAGVAYVGGYDHNLYAINADTGQLLWTFTAHAGFDTNPLVAGNLVYAGNRDGVFYAVHINGPKTGKLAWQYQTAGPIHFSAALDQNVVYFASNDSHAYALDALTGKLIWKSAKLPGAGFHSWWPVIYKDYVVFPGSNNYRFGSQFGSGPLFQLDEAAVYPQREKDPRGTYVGLLGKAEGDWAAGTPTIDSSQPNITENGSTMPITRYLEEKPWRRTYFILDRLTGKEYTTDFDRDGKPEYAPVLWFGTYTGNRFPPVIGKDGVLYQANNYMSDPAIAGGHVTGWKVGTPFISLISSTWNAVDEPVAYSAGGNLIYWNRCCDRVAGAVDISVPYTPGVTEKKREWKYFNYDLPQLIPGYNQKYYYSYKKYTSPFTTFGGSTGQYTLHGDVNPPIPYGGMVYMHRGNAVIAFSPDTGSTVSLPAAKTVPSTSVKWVPQVEQLQVNLENEVSKILDAGHLRPGYINTGIFDARVKACGDKLMDYWHAPAETIVTLIRALPYLPTDLATKAKIYLQTEFQNYPPDQYNHIGWKDGSQREEFDLPPEIQTNLANMLPETSIKSFPGWSFAPQAFYALWKYAEVFGNARQIFASSKELIKPAPSDDVLELMPHVQNATIAGYWGYLELQKLAGESETVSIRKELTRLLDLRVTTFTIEVPSEYFEDKAMIYCRALNISRNFMYLTPELGRYLHDHAGAEIRQAIDNYEEIAPLWFVSRAETAFGEGVLASLYDAHALFQAKALILNESYAELAGFLDVPAVPVGDLFYIDKLVTLLGLNQQMLSN